MRASRAVAGGMMLACAGCALPNPVPEPNAITLKDALVSTVDALNAAAREARKPGNKVFGYYPCRITVTYDISASGMADNKLGLTAGSPPGVGVAISASASHENSLTGTRGNQVMMEFDSAYCLPGAKIPPIGTPGGLKPPLRPFFRIPR